MDSYYIIAGLGNPGLKYDGTRHNVGFKVIDELADRFHIERPVRFGKSMIGKGTIGGEKVILVKPLTYMNLSGEAVREICSYYKADPADHLIVISDDVDLPVGHLRIRKKGSAGGHNGLKNIIPAPGSDLANHVLGHFSSEDRPVIEEAYAKAADAVECAIGQGPDKAMNLYNTKKQKKQKKQKKEAETAEAASEVGENADINSSAEGI